MDKFGNFICKNKKMIFIISCILLILSFIGMSLTKINYDILVYLPNNIETIKGEDILTEDFNVGAYSIAIIDNMKSKDIIKLEDDIKEIDGVSNVVSLYDVLGTSIPTSMLPSKVVNKLHKDNTDLLFITFSDSTSAEETIDAVKEIRNITSDNVRLGGMSSMVLDTMELSNKEILIYIIIAVILCIIVLELSLDSYLVPILLLLNIGFAIVFNLGTNIFLGQISYITKALVAVLQLGVTTDFSIFLYHSYEKNKEKYKSREDAMKDAIKETFISVTGSSLTTIAGFLVLCTMTLTLGKDLGIVMAKGVLLGVITVLTLFPSLLLIFDKYIEKTKKKEFIPKFKHLNKFTIKYHKIIFVCFLLLLIPMYLAYSKVPVYYKMDKTLPDTLESISTNNDLKTKFGLVSTEMILLDRNIKNDDLKSLTKELENINGVDFVLSIEDNGISNVIDNDLISSFKNDKYQLLLLNSNYDIASDELNDQITIVNNIVKKYDKNAIVAGEGPLMKDLINISDTDFNNVNYSSILCIFIILLFVLKSISLPILLISAIEFAIFTNMSISYFDGSILPFVAPIVLGTIQLGATIDYAILISTTYLENRKNGKNKEQSMKETLDYATPSIFISGMCFFAATFGVGIYSDLEMVGSLCTLISRGALISMLVAVTILPSILLIFDKFIEKTTLREGVKMKSLKKIVACLMILLSVSNTQALTKNETVYTNLNYDGTVKKVSVNEQILNKDKLDSIKDYSTLNNILNLSNNNTFTGNKDLIWNASGKNILYSGNIDKRLPIEVSVTYKLDGKEMNIDDMLGKSGKVSITLNYKNNDKHNVLINGKYEVMYTPFIVVTGTVIDSENNTNIEVTNGKIINNGVKDIVISLSTPGLSDSLKLNNFSDMNSTTITYETTNFELSSIYSIVSSKLIDSNDLNIFSKLDNVYNSINELQKNMNLIEDSAKEIKNGSNTLKTKLGTSINTIKNDKSNALSSNQIELIRKQTEATIKNTFNDQYKNNLKEKVWNEVKSNLNNDTSLNSTIENYVKKGVVEYLNSVNEYNDYINCEKGKIILEQTSVMPEENMISCGIIKNDTVLPLVEKLLTEIATNTAVNTSNYVAEKVSKEVAEKVATETALTVSNKVSLSLAPQVANKVKSESIKSMTSSLNTLYDGVNTLDNGINMLSDGITKFNENGITKLTNLVNSLKVSGNRLKAIQKLGNEYDSFAGKLSNYSGETKFVMVIDSKKKEETKENKTAETKKLNFWDRIVNLFK